MGLKILLVVDDQPSVAQVLKDQFESEGYAVLIAGTGQEAVNLVKQTQLAAVLLDLALPDMNGFQVLSKIKELKPNLPVVMVTGNHEESEARKAFDMGVVDYVTKPIDFKYLKNILLIQSNDF